MSVYDQPVYSHKNATALGPGLTIDIGTATLAGYPPVMIAVIAGGAANLTYTIEGSHDGATFADFSGGGYTQSEAKDLIPGVRFWRTNIVSGNSGTLTSSVGAVPTQDGGTRGMNNTITNNSTTSQPGI